MYLSDVPSDHLDSIDGLVKASLKRLAEEGIDMERMGMVLRREKRQVCVPVRFSAIAINDQAPFERKLTLRACLGFPHLVPPHA
jgi:hypothetical protein